MKSRPWPHYMRGHIENLPESTPQYETVLQMQKALGRFAPIDPSRGTGHIPFKRRIHLECFTKRKESKQWIFCSPTAPL